MNLFLGNLKKYIKMYTSNIKWLTNPQLAQIQQICHVIRYFTSKHSVYLIYREGGREGEFCLTTLWCRLRTLGVMNDITSPIT